MSALGAIETPVPSGPDESDAAPRSSARGERPLALVPSLSGPRTAGRTAGPRDPRACSIQGGSRSQADRERRAARRPGTPEPDEARESQQIVLQGKVIRAGTGRPQRARTEPTPGRDSAAAPGVSVRQGVSQPRPGPGAAAAGAGRMPVAPTVRQHGELAPSPIRLTRRGRVVAGVLAVVALTAVALVIIALAASGGAQATNNGQARAGYQGMREIVVQPGQTLWSIASAAEPSVDPRVVVQEIMSANAMTSTTISAGQLLWVPR